LLSDLANHLRVKESSSSPTSSYHALAEYRIERFMADDALANTATLGLRPNRTVYKEDIVRVAGEKMVEKLLTFDEVFYQTEAGKH
jgi:hypothetical protein